MRDTTDEYSFILKPSSHGIGVFATHGIKKGTYLRLFSDQNVGKNPDRLLRKGSVPELFRGFCLDRGDGMLCPHDFGQMPVGWYLNHGGPRANAGHRNPKDENYSWYALRDICAEEEVLIDYNILGEPETARETYYRE